MKTVSQEATAEQGKTQHTGGEWMLSHEPHRGYTVTSASDVTPICVVHARVAKGDDAEAKASALSETVANARLLVAAPDLLAACKAYISTGQGMWSEHWTKINCAIAKAEGGAK